MAEEEDLRRVTVQLSLLSGQDTEAAQKLASSLKEISTMFKVIQSSNFMESARRIAELSKQMQDNQRGQAIQGNAQGHAWSSYQRGVAGPSMENLGNVIAPRDIAREREELARAARQAEQEKQTRAQQEREKAREAARDAAKRAQDQQDAAKQIQRDQQEQEKARMVAEQNRINKLTEPEKKADHLLGEYRQATGQPIPSIGTPEWDAAKERGDWFTNVRSFRGSDTGFTMPQIGHLTMQDYFRTGSRWAIDKSSSVLSGINRNQSPDEVQDTLEKGAQWQKRAAWLDKYDRRVGNTLAIASGGRAIARKIRQGGDILSKLGFNPFTNEQAGTALGYRRNAGDHLLGIPGIQDPFSPAQDEGMRQSMDIWRLRFQAGINGDEAKAIVQGTAAQGFGGSTATNIENGLLAPLQKEGIGPENALPFTSDIRTGASSIERLRRAISGMGDSARAANMTLEDTRRGFESLAESDKTRGGTKAKSIETGNLWQQATTLPAPAFEHASQSPFVQGITTMNTGFPSIAQGALSPNMRVKGVLDSVRLLHSMFKGAGKSTRQDIMGIGADGRPHIVAHTTTPGSALDDSLGAQAANMTVPEYRHMVKNLDVMTKANQLLPMADIYAKQAAHFNNEGLLKAAQGSWGTGISKVNYKTHTITGPSLEDHGKITTRHLNDDEWKSLQEKASKYARPIVENTGQLRAIMHNGNVLGADSIRAQLERSQVFGKDTHKWVEKNLGKSGDPRKQAEHLQQALAKRISSVEHSNDPKLKVEFTGPAAGFFKGKLVGDVKKLANAGGRSTADTAASNTGPLPDTSADIPHW